MSRFTDGLKRDLNQIADHASPSTTTAWESIRARIDANDDGSEMEIIMLSPDLDNHEAPTRRRLLLAASAVVAVLLVIGGLFVASGIRNDDDATNIESTNSTADDSGPDSSAVRIESEAIGAGERFVEAFVNLDADTAVGLIVDQPTAVSVESAADRESVGRLIAAYEAIDTEFEAQGCEFAEPNLVTCGVLWRNAWFGAGDFPPVEGTFNLAMDGEKITSVQYDFDSQLLVEPYNQFLTWMLDNHPEETDGLWLDQNDITQGPSLSDEAIQTFEIRTAEYIASVNEEAAEALLGTWLLSLGPTWEFSDDSIAVTGGAVDRFSYTATNTTIELIDVSCGPEFPGLYGWEIKDDVLTLTRITDGCPGRRDSLDGVTAERVE